MVLKKTTMLFEENVYKQLQEKSKRENISIGELVREAVANYYGIKKKEDRLKALAKLKRMNLPVSDYESMEHEIIKGALIDR
ncbi:MAG: ribbon-helix-helix protein, CopG family [Actinobacteria bacterium]|nr:ribbon-helix-helix protein, CopG family [Actinomycetota bacterium]MBM3713945.1 ribbon-helix-helix protein, CopG family [Actinomycetota bacterium]